MRLAVKFQVQAVGVEETFAQGVSTYGDVASEAFGVLAAAASDRRGLAPSRGREAEAGGRGICFYTR